MKTLALTIQGTPIVPPAGVPSGGLSGPGTNVINVALNLLFLAGIVMAIVFVIYSGVQWVMSGGDKQKLQNARNRLTYSIVGLIVIALSFVIINSVVALLGGNPGFFLNTP